jgi:hypothetical protein
MIKLLYSVFMAIWRRAFGCDGWDLPILKNRFVLHVLGFLATFSLCMFSKGFNWYTSAWIAVWIQIFWALGHGYAYDVSKSGQPDEKMLERYKKAIGYKFLCKIFSKEEHHGMCFDFILLAIRYTYPLLPICLFFNPVFMCLGLIIASLYLIYRFCPVVRKIKILDVEIWAGFFTGLFVSFL